MGQMHCRVPPRLPRGMLTGANSTIPIAPSVLLPGNADSLIKLSSLDISLLNLDNSKTKQNLKKSVRLRRYVSWTSTSLSGASSFPDVTAAAERWAGDQRCRAFHSNRDAKNGNHITVSRVMHSPRLRAEHSREFSLLSSPCLLLPAYLCCGMWWFDRSTLFDCCV